MKNQEVICTYYNTLVGNHISCLKQSKHFYMFKQNDHLYSLCDNCNMFNKTSNDETKKLSKKDFLNIKKILIIK